MTEFIAVRIDPSPFLRSLIECVNALDRVDKPMIDSLKWAAMVWRGQHAEMMARNLMRVRPLPCTNE